MDACLDHDQHVRALREKVVDRVADEYWRVLRECAN
jgi:hypothetical protein